jgi:hypothetical protein
MASPQEVDPSIVDPEREARIEVVGVGQRLIAQAQLYPDQKLSDGWFAMPLTPSEDGPRFGVAYERGQAGVDFCRVEIEPVDDGIKATAIVHSENPAGGSFLDTYRAVVCPRYEFYPPATRLPINVLRSPLAVAMSLYMRPGSKMARIAPASDETSDLSVGYSRNELREDLVRLEALALLPSRRSSRRNRSIGRRAINS